MSVAAPWRFASRLARREVRRRPGRTMLVVLLVAIPVMGMTVFSVMARTLDGDDSWFRQFPDGTDIVVAQPFASAVDFEEQIPDAAPVTRGVGGMSLAIETSRGAVFDDVLLVDSAAIAEPGAVFSLSSGDRPGSGEVWMSTALADRLGASVGDEVALRHPAGKWTVAGLGRFRDDFDRRAIVMPDLPVEQFRADALVRWTLIDLGDDASTSDVGAVGASISSMVNEATDGGFVNWQREMIAEGSAKAASLAWGWVAGTIALAATGIIVAGAFATSARRQLTTIGLLSSNGASERVTRRMLALQGLWTGVVGSLAGIAVAVILLLASRSTIEHLRGRALLPYQFAAFDLVVIALTGVAAATVAALVPARTASRVPVIAALAGRRPLGAVPRRLVPTGLGLFALGVFLMVVAASSENGGDAAAAAAVLGGVSVLAGVCCCSPLAIDTLSRIAAGVGGSWRFAGRSLGRTRTRSAAVVTAIAVTGSLAAAGSALAEKIDDGADRGRQLPADAVALVPVPDWPPERDGYVDFEPTTDQPVDASLRRSLDDIVPSATWHDRRIATWDAAPARFDDHGLEPMLPMLWPVFQIIVADPAMIDLYELTASERESLEETGLLALQGWAFEFDSSDTRSITISTESGDVSLPYAIRHHMQAELEASIEGRSVEDEFTGVYGIDPFMITEEAARSAGFDLVVSGAFLRSDAPLTESQRAALEDVFYGGGGRSLGSIYRDVPIPLNRHTEGHWHWPSWTPPPFAVQASIVGAALLLTLLVVAIGLALASTESHDERDVLIAVGARPRTMRSMAGAKAVVITLTGVVLAVPAGLVPIAAVMRAVDESFQVPWAALGLLVIGVPLLGGGAAWLVSAVAQRARPPQMSTLAFE